MKFFSIILFSLVFTGSAYDFTGKWKNDSEKSKAYLKEIGAAKELAVNDFQIEIYKDHVSIEKQKYPAFKFALTDNECLIFYKNQEPVIISPVKGGIEVLNYLPFPFICKKTDQVKPLEDKVKGLEGRWHLKEKSLKQYLANFPIPIEIKNIPDDTSMLELELRGNTFCLYICSVPIPLSSTDIRLELIKDKAGKYTINSISDIGTEIVAWLKKIDDKTLELSVPGNEQKLILVKSTYKTKKVKFTKEYIEKELKAVLAMIDQLNIPDDDDYTKVEKMDIKSYIYFLLKDKKSLKELVENAKNNVSDPSELSFFYENIFLDTYRDISLKEALEFYNKYLISFKDEYNLISIYLSIAEKCHDEKDPRAANFLKLGEEAAKNQLKFAKEASEEEYPYEYQTYLYNRAYLQWTYLHMGLKDKFQIEKEAPMVKLYYWNMRSEDLKLEGKLKESNAELQKSINLLKHLPAHQLVNAFLDCSYYLNKYCSFKNYIVPWKKLEFLDQSPEVDEFDKGMLYINLAVYYYTQNHPARAYYYLYKCFNTGNMHEQGYLVRILGQIDNGSPLRLFLALSSFQGHESNLYTLSDYVYFLHSCLDNLKIDKK